MPATSLAYAAASPGAALELRSFAVAPLAADQVEVAVEFCGICHSDLSMLNNDWKQSSYPFVPGHEVIGKIVATGAQARRVQVGDRVGIGWYSSSCMACERCLAGQHQHCSQKQRTLVGRHGGFAQTLRCHWAWAIPLPPTLHLESAAPLFCGGLTVFNAITSGGVKPTDRVAVVGIGGLGHLALQFLNKWGCEVTAFSSNPEKRDAVLALGAHHVLGTHSSHDLAKRREAFDWILVTSPATLDWQAYIQALAPEGRLHFVGMVSEAVPVPVRLLMAHKAVTASSPGGLATIAKMLEFSARHGIRPLTEELPMSAANEALRRLAAGDVRYRFVLRNDIGEDSN